MQFNHVTVGINIPLHTGKVKSNLVLLVHESKLIARSKLASEIFGFLFSACVPSCTVHRYIVQ